MAHDLDEALVYLLEEEGGWSDNKNDKGGKTMYGITQITYSSYRRWKKLPDQSVKNVTKTEAYECYEHFYWQPSGCDRLPWPISYLTFDAAVNSGVSRSVKWTQQGLEVPVDGKIGSQSIAAASRAVEDGNAKSIIQIVDARVQFLSGLVKSEASQGTFLLGWWRRTLRVLARALLSELD